MEVGYADYASEPPAANKVYIGRNDSWERMAGPRGYGAEGDALPNPYGMHNNNDDAARGPSSAVHAPSSTTTSTRWPRSTSA